MQKSWERTMLSRLESAKASKNELKRNSKRTQNELTMKPENCLLATLVDQMLRKRARVGLALPASAQ